MKSSLSFEGVLTRSTRFQARLMNRIIQSGGRKLPTSASLADGYGVSVNTVKEVCSSMAREGYLQQNKRAGTFIRNPYSEEQVRIYMAARDRIINILGDLRLAGINDTGIIACALSALDDYRSEPVNVIYTDTDFYGLLMAKKELETVLGVQVMSMFTEELLEKVSAQTLEPGIVITSFRTVPLLSGLPRHIRVIPLKTTPPLEQLVNFSRVPTDARITLVVISEEIRQRVQQTYKDLIRSYPFFDICSISQVRMNRELVKDTSILLTLKTIYTEHEPMLNHIPRIMTYNRFHDDEGISMLKKFIRKNHSPEDEVHGNNRH